MNGEKEVTLIKPTSPRKLVKPTIKPQLNLAEGSDLEVAIKSNMLTSGMFHLTNGEYQVVNTAMMHAKQETEIQRFFDSETVFRISYKDFSKLWGMDSTNAKKLLVECCLSLRQKSFWYYAIDPENNSKRLYESGWFAYVSPELINGEYLEFGFPKPLIPLIKSYRAGSFTWYYINQIKKLNRFYSVRLYELFHQYKNQKNKVKLTIEEIRNLFLFGDEVYKNNAEMKRSVLKPAIEDIVSNTDLKVKMNDIKSGRSLAGFEFVLTFTEKDLDFNGAIGYEPINRDQNTPDMFNKMTEKQINTFSKKLANDIEFGTKYAGMNEKPNDFLFRIKSELKDSIKLAEYMPYLIKVGYSNKG